MTKADCGIPSVILLAEPFRPMLAQAMENRRPPMADIFISYASVDRPVARRLADALEAHGWSVWWDHRSLRGGQHFDRVIEETIHSATVVIVVWSKASVESGWVRDEATLALEEGKLVPLRIDTARLPMRFRNIHTIDLAAWIGEIEAEPFQRLVKDLTHYLGPSTSLDKPEHLGIPAAPDPRTAVPLGEDEQPTETLPIAERSQASPSGGLPHASTLATQPTLTIDPLPRAGRKRMGKYFAAVVVTVGVVWSSMVALEESQPPSVKSSTEASSPKLPDSTGDASTAQAAYERGDYATALSLARPAAERGDPVAQYILGKLYDNGQGVMQIYVEAMRWYRKAADQGQTDAQYNIGAMYNDGRGVTQDKAQARAWMQKAAAAGNENAKKWLAKN